MSVSRNQHAGLFKLSSVPSGSAASHRPKEVESTVSQRAKMALNEKGQRKLTNKQRSRADGLQVVDCQTRTREEKKKKRKRFVGNTLKKN